MSFHPDITHLEPFVPHNFDALTTMCAFPEGAMPEGAYQKICTAYEGVEDVSVQRITYQSDGLKITGIMAEPSGAPKGIVIYNRGGSGNYGILTVHAVMRQFVPLARAGYLVIGSNYRGNDGGEGQDEFGGRDVGDIIALYNISKAHPLAGEKPPFIIGHSRGGMMANLLLKNGLQARAAIAIAAVSDVRGWNQTNSEMRERVYKRFIPNFEAREQEALTERSAVCWPEAISCPLLLLHGTGDDRVPHAQSEALANELKQLGKPHELVLYEGGNHALTRNWDAVMQETLNWLVKHDA